VRTFVALVAGSTLRARLIAILALVLVTGAADGEPTLIAGHEKLPFDRDPHVVSTNLTNAAVDIAQGFRLQGPHNNPTSLSEINNTASSSSSPFCLHNLYMGLHFL